MWGQAIEFSVDYIPYTNGNAIWVDAASTDITNIRGELGLNPDYIPHLFYEGKLVKKNG